MRYLNDAQIMKYLGKLVRTKFVKKYRPSPTSRFMGFK